MLMILIYYKNKYSKNYAYFYLNTNRILILKMNKITWILLLFTVLIVSSKASDERSEQANLVKALIDKQGKLEVTWKELMTVLVGIEYEITSVHQFS